MKKQRHISCAVSQRRLLIIRYIYFIISRFFSDMKDKCLDIILAICWCLVLSTGVFVMKGTYQRIGILYIIYI